MHFKGSVTLLGHKTILVVPELVPGSEIVGSAKLRRREYANKTGGNPFLVHVLILSRALHLRVIRSLAYESS